MSDTADQEDPEFEAIVAAFLKVDPEGITDDRAGRAGRSGDDNSDADDPPATD